ncbi:MAG: hypothetical protein C0401_05095 [Anaerolinea sp.]|nr:hypothetical protein [Anaerolinea sp.]
MSPFSGFNSAKTKTTPVPAAFFTDLLPEINDLAELKVTIYAFWYLDLQEGDLRYLTLEDFLGDSKLSVSFGKTLKEAKTKIMDALERTIRRGTLLTAQTGDETLYFLNSPRGRAALEGLLKGSWTPGMVARPNTKIEANRPNIFALYEQNIGPLTPIISDTLQDAEKMYPADWINDAVKIAVTKNVRNWRFIDAILRAWKEKGRDEKDQRSSKENRKRDSEGEFGDYIIH